MSATSQPATIATSPLRSVRRALLRRPALARLLVIAGLFLLWEASARWWIDPIFLSPPSRVVTEMGALFETRGVSISNGCLWNALERLGWTLKKSHSARQSRTARTSPPPVPSGGRPSPA